MTNPTNPAAAPAGWYDDTSGTGTQRYWDGQKWTDATQPAPPQAAVPAAPEAPAPAGSPQPTPAGGPVTGAAKRTNTLGIAALVVAALGFIFACIPGALIVGWVLLPVGFVLAIVALFLKGKGKGLAIAALITAIVGTILGFVVFFAVVSTSFNNAFGGTGTTIKASGEAASAGPTQAAAPAAKTGTRENPAPLSSAVVGKDFTVKINSVNLNATDAVHAANQFNDAPDAGMTYALVNATVTYMGKDSAYAAEADIAYVGADGKVYNSFDKSVVAPDPVLGANELYAGASATGNIVIQIPAAGDGLLRVRPGVIADEVFVATK